MLLQVISPESIREEPVLEELPTVPSFEEELEVHSVQESLICPLSFEAVQ